MGMMYVEQFVNAGGAQVLRVRHRNGAVIFDLRGGLADAIALNIRRLERLGGGESDAYVDGIVDALIHVAMTGEVPTIPH